MSRPSPFDGKCASRMSSLPIPHARRPRSWKLLLRRFSWAGSGYFFFISDAFAHVFDHATIEQIGPFLAGISHPILGIDHFLAMFAVGFLSSIIGGRHLWQVPACFVLVMPMGWLLGHWAAPFPSVGIGIAASVASLGALGLFARAVPRLTVFAAVGVFALFHGYAHGSETPLDVHLFQYVLGFMTGTAGLHLLGLTMGDVLRKANVSTRIIPVVNGSIFLLGIYFILSAAVTSS
jgi:urease accessory protein